MAPGIMDDESVTKLGGSVEAGRLCRAFEAYIAHHAEVEARLAAAQRAARDSAPAVRAARLLADYLRDLKAAGVMAYPPIIKTAIEEWETKP